MGAFKEIDTIMTEHEDDKNMKSNDVIDVLGECLTEQVIKLTEEKRELEDKHWNECRQISEYEIELKTYKSGYFRLLDQYLALKMMLDNQTERFENERAINEKLKKRLNNISEPLSD